MTPDHSADEPTEEMLRVGYITLADRADTMGPYEVCREIYKAMRAARPEAQAAPKLTEEFSEDNPFIGNTPNADGAYDDSISASLHAQAGVSGDAAADADHDAERVREAVAISTDGRRCQCSVCIRSRNFASALDTIPPQHHALLNAMFGALEDAEFERDHLRAVIEGSWPDADAVIAFHRKRRAAAVQPNAPTACASDKQGANEPKPSSPPAVTEPTHDQ